MKNIRLDMHELHLERMSSDLAVRDEQIRNAVGKWLDTVPIQQSFVSRREVARRRGAKFEG